MSRLVVQDTQACQSKAPPRNLYVEIASGVPFISQRRLEPTTKLMERLQGLVAQFKVDQADVDSEAVMSRNSQNNNLPF